MKKNFKTFLFLSAIILATISCKDKAKEATTTEAEAVKETEIVAKKHSVDVEASSIVWKGFKPTGTHNGTINLESGVLQTVDGKITGGTFLIDMNSIKDADGSSKLEGHLKSDAFFDVEKHPTATFEITGLETAEDKTMLSGNLALKDAENNVTFPVNVTNKDGITTLTSEAFTIDRTKWNVQYGSKSIFDNLGDKFINDDIELKVIVKTTKS